MPKKNAATAADAVGNPPAEGTLAPPPSGPVAVQNTRLKVLRTHPGYPHHPGQETEMDPESAQALANGGFVQLLTTDVTAPETR